jgi:uncharacterized protein YqgV (UPF0045/DUF77 family)
MMQVKAEFTVEPFVEGQPGEHVEAAAASFVDAQLAVEVGPFSSATVGEIAEVAPAVGRMLAAAFDAGATTVHLQVTRVA